MGEDLISESNAILLYLCETLNWDDVYPLAPGKARERAEVQKWLHWFHLNTRQFSGAYFLPALAPHLKVETQERRKGCVATAKFMDEHLAQNKFLAVGFQQPTLADFVAFADVGQCEDLDIFDFAPYPNLRRWMRDMRALKGYAESHQVLTGLKAIVDRNKRAGTAKL